MDNGKLSKREFIHNNSFTVYSQNYDEFVIRQKVKS